MNRTIVAGVLLGCVLVLGAWLIWPSGEAPVQGSAVVEMEKREPAAPASEPLPAAPALKEVSPEVVEAAPEPEAAVPEEAVPQEVAADDPFGGKPITVETLTGCKEVQNLQGTPLEIEYAPNGVWKVNGNARAQWTIEGNRVKVYKDGTDEVHYIDIVGNKLVYEGKEVAMTR